MSTLGTQDPAVSEVEDHLTGPARRIIDRMGGCRVQFTWLSTHKGLTRDQRGQAADNFGADQSYVSASKKLFDTKDDSFRRVTAVKSEIGAFWYGLTLPYIEPGVRLIRLDKMAGFDEQMTGYRAMLAEAVLELDRRYSHLVAEARERLGALYNPDDYPGSIADCFNVSWDYPNLSPPDYLRFVDPNLHEQEVSRIAQRFEETVQLVEQAFLQEFGNLVNRLTERLDGLNGDGTPKVFRDTAVGNLREFFLRFRSLGLRSNFELERLVAEAQRVLDGVSIADLRTVSGIRSLVHDHLSAIAEQIDVLTDQQPAAAPSRVRRRIIRPVTEEA